MSEEHSEERTPEAAAPQPKTGLGCGGWFGIVILIVAVSAVIFYFVIRPALQEKGVDVDSKLDDLRTTGERAWKRVRGEGEEAAEKVSRAGETVKEAAAEAAEKTGELAGKAQSKGEEVSRKVKEKAEETAEKVDAWY